VPLISDANPARVDEVGEQGKQKRWNEKRGKRTQGKSEQGATIPWLGHGVGEKGCARAFCFLKEVIKG